MVAIGIRIFQITLAAVLTVWIVTPVRATPITETYAFLAFDFTPLGLVVAAPVDPVIGVVTVTFDPDGPAVTNQTTGVKLRLISLIYHHWPTRSRLTTFPMLSSKSEGLTWGR
jgi:hypothetical protein